MVVNGFQAPTKSRLTSFLAKLRREKYGDEKLNYGSLHQWLDECSSVPTNESDPFIADFEVNIDDVDEKNSSFRFFVTSKILLKNALNAKVIHTDATYKLIWQGFPVLLVGTTDADRRFHLIGISVSTNEKTEDFEFLFKTMKKVVFDIYGVELKPTTLICDAAAAIRNGFRNIFGAEMEVIMCWAHMRRATAKKLPQFIRDTKKQNEFLADIDNLQISKCRDDFKRACELFLDKWRPVSNDLVEYFTNEWCIQNPNWYEGFAIMTPSTNNALESFNRVIKDEQTLRELMDLSQFRFVLFNMIKQYSTEYVAGLNKRNVGQPTIELKMWTNGYNFARSNIKITSSRRGNSITYLISLSARNYAVDPDSWNTFNDFKQSLSMVHTKFRYPVSEANCMDGQCDCSDFLKLFMCEHVIGVALRLKCVSAPIEAKTIPIGQKRKRGRPALERQ